MRRRWRRRRRRRSRRLHLGRGGVVGVGGGDFLEAFFVTDRKFASFALLEQMSHINDSKCAKSVAGLIMNDNTEQ